MSATRRRPQTPLPAHGDTSANQREMHAKRVLSSPLLSSPLFSGLIIICCVSRKMTALSQEELPEICAQCHTELTHCICSRGSTTITEKAARQVNELRALNSYLSTQARRFLRSQAPLTQATLGLSFQISLRRGRGRGAVVPESLQACIPIRLFNQAYSVQII